MSDDTISRQAAIDALDGEIEVTGKANAKAVLKYTKMVCDRIKALPSAQPEPRWIPVTERLPEYGEPVLTWDGFCYCIEKRIPCIRDDDGEPIYSDWWVSDDYVEEESDFYPNLRDGACIAWMPLPESYRGGEDE